MSMVSSYASKCCMARLGLDYLPISTILNRITSRWGIDWQKLWIFKYKARKIWTIRLLKISTNGVVPFQEKDKMEKILYISLVIVRKRLSLKLIIAYHWQRNEQWKIIAVGIKTSSISVNSLRINFSLIILNTYGYTCLITDDYPSNY